MATSPARDVSLRLLLIGGSHDDARQITERLDTYEAQRFVLSRAGSLEAATRELRTDAPDVVLLDLGHPDSSGGLDALRQCRVVAPSVPIVVLADRDEEIGLRCVAEGAQDCLVKEEAGQGKQLPAILCRAIERQRLVSELRRKADLARDESENLSRLIAASLDAKLVVGRDGVILFANPAAERLCDKTRKELVGSSFNLPISGEGVKEVELPCRNDQPIMAEMHVTELEWQGIPAFLVVLHDITQRLRIQRKLIETNRALKESEVRFKAFGEASPAALTIKDIQGRYVLVNQAFASRCGLPSDEIVGRTADGVFPPEMATKIRGYDHDALGSDTVLSFEMEGLLADGRRVVDWVVKFPLHDADGELAGLGNISTEITERKMAEEALQRSVRSLRTLSACNEALIRARSEENLLSEICRLVVQVGEYPFAWVGLVEGDATQIIPVAQFGEDQPDLLVDRTDRAGSACPAIRAVQTGCPAIIREQAESPCDSACRDFLVRHDVQSAIALPLKNGKGSLGALMIFSRNPKRFDDEEIKLLSELANDLAFGIQSLRADARRRSAEEEARKLQRAVQQSPGIVMITDADGVIEYVNPKFTEVTGYSVEEAIGHKPGALLKSGETSEEEYARMWAEIRAGHTWKGRLHNCCKDGSPYWAETAISPVRADDGRITHFIGLQEDITKKLETERRLRQSEKMESLGNLAGGIAHDFNNMLLPILTLSSMAMRDLPEESRQRQRLGMVVEAAERARALVQRILAFSRTADSTRESTDMATIVEDSVDLLRVTLPRTIEVITDLDPETGEGDIDRAQVQTMILNLASNSADAMGGKPGRLEISLARMEIDGTTEVPSSDLPDGSYAKLTLKDTGTGIPQEMLSRIFEPFFTTKKVGEGTGLGLAMVHGIVTEHRGSISVESEMGAGTTFHILLPLKSPNEAAGTTAEE